MKRLSIILAILCLTVPCIAGPLQEAHKRVIAGSTVAGGGGDPIAFVGTPSSGNTTGAVAHTVPSGTSMVVVGIGWYTGGGALATITSVKWDSGGGNELSCTEAVIITEGDYFRSTALYYCISPTAATDDITVEWSGTPGDPCVLVANLENTATTSPIRTYCSDEDGWAGGQTVACTLTGVQSTDMVIGMAFDYQATTEIAYTDLIEQISAESPAVPNSEGFLAGMINGTSEADNSDYGSAVFMAVKQE